MTVHNENPSFHLPVKRAFCFAMAPYCLKSSIPILPDHQSANRDLSWLPCLVSIGTNEATKLFTHLFEDRKNKEVIIETP